MQDNKDGDLFVHINDVNGRIIDEDDIVEFEIGQGPKGDNAKNVIVIEEAR